MSHARLAALPAGPHGLLSARPEPDLAAYGYEETEYVAAGRATSYTASDWPADGRLAVTPGGSAEFATRVVVRRPPPERASGTLVVEWFNVSSGADACPDWTFAAPEILRRGHVWAGVSAQRTGVEGGRATVAVDGAPSAGIKGADPERYGGLHHPGDAFAYDLFTQVAGAVRDLVGAQRVLAMGESQSAALLTTYVNGVHPLARLFDGFLLHSRLGVAAPLGEAGAGIDLEAALGTGAVRLRDDLAEPVVVVQAEGDLFDRVGYLPARQPDGDRFRLWEVAGAAHADRYTIDQFEDLLGCAVPVNRGQQWAVVRAALRALDRWVSEGVAPPSAPPLEVAGDDFVRDEHGLVRGGVRTPVVDAPVEVLSGRPWPGASVACRLFGSTTPLEACPWASPEEYLAAYERATDAAVGAGFLLADDRIDVLAEARPDLVLPREE